MTNKTNLYSDFMVSKVSSYLKNGTTVCDAQNKKQVKKIDPRPVLGAAIGVGSAILISHNIFKNKKGTLFEVMEMLTMAGFGNIGGVIGGSFDKTKDEKIKKWKEAGFQMMNTSIPMIMVSSVISLCNNVKQLNKVPIKIISSAIAMATGAMLATKITNLGKKGKEQKRKYSIKDSIANFDDIIATISIGFKKVLNYVPVNKLLPFIYAYCGVRSGLAGDMENENYKDK